MINHFLKQKHWLIPFISFLIVASLFLVLKNQTTPLSQKKTACQQKPNGSDCTLHLDPLESGYCYEGQCFSFKTEPKTKEEVIIQVDFLCQDLIDGYLQNLVKERSFTDQVTVYLHAEKELTSSQLEKLRPLGAEVYSKTWLSPDKQQEKGFLLVKIPINELPAVCSLGFIEKLTSAEVEAEPQ